MNNEELKVEGEQVAEEPQVESQAEQAESKTEQAGPEKVTAERTTSPDKVNVMGILSYLGPLVIASYVTSKDDPAVKFHIKQGLVLFAIEAAAWLLAVFIPHPLFFILKIVNIGTLVLSIIGIVNVIHGHEKELPLVGKYAHKFKI